MGANAPGKRGKKAIRSSRRASRQVAAAIRRSVGLDRCLRVAQVPVHRVPLRAACAARAIFKHLRAEAFGPLGRTARASTLLGAVSTGASGFWEARRLKLHETARKCAVQQLLDASWNGDRPAARTSPRDDHRHPTPVFCGFPPFGMETLQTASNLHRIAPFLECRRPANPHECSLRARACHAGGRGFESRPLRHLVP